MTDSWSLVDGKASGPDGKGGIAQVLAVHAALLPIGRSGSILYYAGDQWIEPTQWEAIENETPPSTDPRYPAGRPVLLWSCVDGGWEPGGRRWDTAFSGRRGGDGLASRALE